MNSHPFLDSNFIVGALCMGVTLMTVHIGGLVPVVIGFLLGGMNLHVWMMKVRQSKE